MTTPTDPVKIATHRLVVTLDREDVRVSVECLHTGADRPCATHYDHEWDDDVSCRCVSPDCPCRQGDHDACDGDLSGYIEEVGPKCRAMPADECWFVHAVGEEPDILDVRPPIKMTVPIILDGCSFEEPIAARVPCTSEEGQR